MNTLIDPVLYEFAEEQRAFIAGLDGPFPPPPDTPPEVLPAENRRLPGRPEVDIRIIRPETPVRGVYLHIHGGGFMHGDAAMGDVANSALARALSVATVSIGYRLAPHHAHPAARDDCLATAMWLIDSARTEFGTEALLIGGDSVGASLSVMTLLALRDRHGVTGAFAGANLVVGNYDFAMTPSQRAATENHFLSPAHLAETRTAAFPGLTGEALRNAEISTLYADLSGMPPAIFTVGTADSVLDDSLFMAARWRAAGNHARLEIYPEAPHLFMAYPTKMAAEADRRIRDFMQAVL